MYNKVRTSQRKVRTSQRKVTIDGRLRHTKQNSRNAPAVGLLMHDVFASIDLSCKLQDTKLLHVDKLISNVFVIIQLQNGVERNY